VCRLLSFGGLRDRRCGIGYTVESSRSELLAAWTSGLVGGRSPNWESADCACTRCRRCGSLSGTLAARKCGKSLCHGATGDVANNPVISSPPLSLLLSSLKSPECKADLGRSISMPAAALLQPLLWLSVLFGDSCSSGDASSDLGCDEGLLDARLGGLLVKSCLNIHVGEVGLEFGLEVPLLILSISSARLLGLSTSSARMASIASNGLYSELLPHSDSKGNSGSCPSSGVTSVGW
jgi:hypothetical protein